MFIFVDFDGVLRPVTSAPGQLDDACLRRFEDIVRGFPDAQIVVSSTWRLGMSLRELRQLFSPGLAKRVVGVTPDLGTSPRNGRYREVIGFVQGYLNTRDENEGPTELQYVHWVALDDDPYNYPRETLDCNVVLTDPVAGFDDDAANRLRSLLEGPGKDFAARGRRFLMEYGGGTKDNQ